MSLQNTLALVTGAASGIGLEIAVTFAKEGATVIAVDVQEKVNEVIKDFDTSQNQNHSSFLCDVSKSEQVTKLFEDIKAKYTDKRVPNVVVNCAGIYIMSKFVDITDEMFDKIVGVNFKGPFLVTRAIARELIRLHPEANVQSTDTYASIINISSISAKKGFPYNQSVYAGTKGALDAMTKQCAFELAEYRIRVNSVAPGPIRTPLNATLSRTVSDIHQGMTYFNRLGESHEVAEACVFLASNKSSYITGTVLDVNGGCN